MWFSIQGLIIFLIYNVLARYSSIDEKIIVTILILLSSTLNLHCSNSKNKKIHRGHEDNKKILMSILEINDSILKIQKTEELFKLILNKVVELIDDAQMGSLLILNEDNCLEFKATVGFEFDSLTNVQLKLENTFLYRKNNGKITKACRIEDVMVFNENVIDAKTLEQVNNTDFFITQSALSAPIIIDGVLYGMINVDNKRKNAFKEDDLILMDYFASQIGAVIQRHQLLEKMIYLSQFDSLTNVFNRSHFDELFKTTLKEHFKNNNKIFTLALFDMDNLKITNDTYGHDVGDRLIKTFAEKLKTLGGGDIIARYGGDEFVAIYLGKSLEQTENMLKLLISTLEEEVISLNNDKIKLEFSYGLAQYPSDGVNQKSLVTVADLRMYSNKKEKKSSAKG